MIKSFEVHPIAEIFPLLTGKAFESFAEDVKENGIREPVVLLEGKILDGRNRVNAATSVGVEIPTREFKEGNPLAFVVSANLHRRHLRQAQRALVAARLANCPQGGRHDLNQRKGWITTAEAAQLLAVSERSVRSAKVIVERGETSLIEMVETGKLSCFAACSVAKLPSARQSDLIARGPSAISAHARRHGALTDRRGKYAEIYKCIDEVCDALEAGRLDLADRPAMRLVEKIKQIARA